MKSKSLVWALSLALCIGIPSVDAAFVVENTPYEISGSNFNTAGTKHKVVFDDASGSNDKTIYVENGTTLSLKDAPIKNTDSEYYVWTEEASGMDLAKSDIVVDKDLTFKGVATDYPTSNPSIGADYRESNRSDGIKSDSSADKSILYSDIDVQVTDPVISNDVKTYISFVDGSSYTNDYSLLAATDSGDAAINYKLINGSKQNLGDGFIGLDAVDRETSDYQPTKGNTNLGNSTNYCVYRFVLNQDTILTSSFILAGHNGYYCTPDSGDYLRSREYSGYINGQYCEIDLNGHDLILANGSSLTAYGSITDSSENKTGNLVLENGSTFMSSMVTEAQYHETDIFSAYKYSLDPFRMFRCPYINCNMVIEAGAIFQGRILKADGGNNTTVGFGSVANLVGPNTDALMQLKFGTIKRKVSYDEKLRKLNSDTDNINRNIMYQKITYEAYDADIDVHGLQFNDLVFKIKVLGIEIGSINFDIHSTKYQMWIPPYFSFYIYNSSVKIHQEFIFMPGVYMYVDKNSTITLSNTSVENIDIKYSINTVLKDGAQGVGGMVFLPKFQLISQHGVAHSIINDGEGDASQPMVLYNCDDFWDYYNTQGAKCDFYGTLKFEDDVSTHAHQHELGGNINFSDKAMLENAYKSHSSVQLYGNAVFGDLQYGIKVSLVKKKTVSFLAGGFYRIPLISNGVCLYDPTTNSLASDNQYYYDSDMSLIRTYNNQNTAYFFAPTWPDSRMSHPYGSNSGTVGSINSDGDSLLGSFQQVDSFNETNLTLVYGGQSYINFQGGYIKASRIDGNSATAKLGCAVGGDDGTNYETDYTFSLKTANTAVGTVRTYWRKN